MSGRRLAEFDGNASSLALPQAQSVSANFDLDRVSQWRDAEQFKFDAGSQPHFKQSNRNLVHSFDLQDSSSLPDSGVGQDIQLTTPGRTITLNRSASRKQSF